MIENAKLDYFIESLQSQIIQDINKLNKIDLILLSQTSIVSRSKGELEELQAKFKEDQFTQTLKDWNKEVYRADDNVRETPIRMINKLIVSLNKENISFSRDVMFKAINGELGFIPLFLHQSKKAIFIYEDYLSDKNLLITPSHDRNFFYEYEREKGLPLFCAKNEMIA